MLAERMKKIEASPTLKVLLAAAQLKRQGVDVVDLGAGEPDFPTPSHVKAAAQRAIEENFTRYTPNAGIPELKQAIADSYRSLYDVAFDEREIIATAGGKQALFNIALALFGPGDEVIIHAPYWPTLVEVVRLAEATPVLVRTHADNGFRVRAETILAAVTPRTKGIVINSPGNPTGALMSEDDMAAVADAAAAKGIWVVLDLCYERLIYDPHPHDLVGVLTRRARDRAVLAGSASKAYAMTGWRCGWVVGPVDVVAACNAIQSHSTSNVSSITQKAAVAALSGPQDCVASMLAEYRVRRDHVHAWLTADGRITCLKPAGAFYLFPDVTALLSPTGIRTTNQLAEALLHEARVALTAGEAFDAPGYVRISYATSLDRLREGTDRILAFADRVTGSGASAR
jgi:aspartate aminotransferase